MLTKELHQILSGENKYTKKELCNILYKLKEDCYKEYSIAVENGNMKDQRYYAGEQNAFQICLDLLEHLKSE